jgi:hypothetical protein
LRAVLQYQRRAANSSSSASAAATPAQQHEVRLRSNTSLPLSAIWTQVLGSAARGLQHPLHLR